MRVPPEIRFNFRSDLLDFQSFTKNPVFYVLVHTMILFLLNLVVK